ncbi:MAG: 3-deoxy-manno-octulosonate cytidylyltransferase [Saprospiraceae bacterium]|nr:3-deoxy-manno-octulosonate cytidylyltransferase [Saprospiraceae bacterium]
MNTLSNAVLAVIPARLSSSRLPGKVLLPIGDKSMLQRVYERCLQCKQINQVIIATDHQSIFEHARFFGARVEMTSTDHLSGTDRVAEVAERNESFSHVVNVQADEPFLEPLGVDLLVEVLLESQAPIATLVSYLDDEALISRPSVVKVVRDVFGNALYFSRAAIPFRRDEQSAGERCTYFRHHGIYAFERQALLRIRSMAPGILERCEQLEQLRWLENGLRIMTAVVDGNGPGIDTPADYEAALRFAMQKNL